MTTRFKKTATGGQVVDCETATRSKSRMDTRQTTRKQYLSLAPPTLDHSFFCGVWQNTDAAGGGIIRVVFDDKEGGLRMQVFGAGEPEAIDWDAVEVRVFAENVDSQEGTEFATVYDFDFMQVQMHESSLAFW